MSLFKFQKTSGTKMPSGLMMPTQTLTSCGTARTLHAASNRRTRTPLPPAPLGRPGPARIDRLVLTVRRLLQRKTSAAVHSSRARLRQQASNGKEATT